MKFLNYILFIAVCFLVACEEDVTPIDVEIQRDIVVEGYIEGGEVPIPPIVALTRSFPFNRAVRSEELSDLFVHDAQVEVSDGTESVMLEEVCWDQLTIEQKRFVTENFDLGIDADNFRINVCLYTDLDFSFLGEVGKTYSLSILADDKALNASTTIPTHVPIDSLYLQPRAGDNSVLFQELVAIIADPEETNFYRYFTSVNGNRFRIPLTSVADDLFFNGQTFEFPLPKALDGTPTPQSEFGFYEQGDSVVIRWTNIDEPHFNFWNTVEFNSFNQGPFASYTRIESNIEGGLGIWGGYSNSYYFIEVL